MHCKANGTNDLKICSIMVLHCTILSLEFHQVLTICVLETSETHSCSRDWSVTKPNSKANGTNGLKICSIMDMDCIILCLEYHQVLTICVLEIRETHDCSNDWWVAAIYFKGNGTNGLLICSKMDLHCIDTMPSISSVFNHLSWAFVWATSAKCDLSTDWLTCNWNSL